VRGGRGRTTGAPVAVLPGAIPQGVPRIERPSSGLPSLPEQIPDGADGARNLVAGALTSAVKKSIFRYSKTTLDAEPPEQGIPAHAPDPSTSHA